MKRLLSLLLFAMVISVRAGELPPELKNMRESYQLELEKATDSLRSKYVAALDKLLNSYMRNGNLEAAILVKEEIEKLQGSNWEGRWSFGPFLMTILPEGKFIESNQNGTTNDEGKWTKNKDGTIHLVFNNGHKCVAVMHKENKTAMGNLISPTGVKFTRPMKRLEE